MGATSARILLAATAAAASLAVAPAASAQSCQAPPGRAAVEQYCESVPGPGGDRGINAGGKSIRLSPKALQAREVLKRAGSDGRGVSQFLAAAPATAAPGAAAAGGSAGSRGGGATTPGSGPAGGSGTPGKGDAPARSGDIGPAAVPGGFASAVQASSSAGAGVLLAVGLAGALLALSVFLVRRRASR